jgi:glucan phosphoethanolaminetransferase (alkaline phosphatase superfamily)
MNQNGKPERRLLSIRVLALIITCAGTAVLLGWIFDISILKSISPQWISMKVSTAFCFVLSGISLYFIAEAARGEFDVAQVVLSITSMVLALFMGILLFSFFFRIHTGAEQLFIQELDAAVKTVTPGMPSFPTMLNFILMAVAGVLTILDARHLRKCLKVIGLAVAAIGACAVMGYLTNAPILYYSVAGLNSAMAFHTAVLFVLWGGGLLCL